MKIISDAIDKSLDNLGLEKVGFAVEHPVEESHGDYATNVAMVMGKKEGKNPRELAEKIKSELEKDVDLMGIVAKIEIAGPGFVNFYFKKSWLVEEMRRVSFKGDKYGSGEWGKGKRVLVDYSSPNIAKRFSVGHLRSTVIGQAVRNLYEFSGWETIGDNHLGDWGTQFGMIIAAVEEDNLDISKMSVEEMEEVYVAYNKKVKEDESYLDKARKAFARLEQGDEKARCIWQEAIDASMTEFDRIYELLGVKIEYTYGESAYEELMPEVIEEAKSKGVITEGEGGAGIVEFEKMSPAMIVKSNNTTTYFTRDMAAIKFREQSPELKSDLYVYEVGSEQTLHFRQLFEVAEMMGWLSKDNLKHIAHGNVLGEDGKRLSTRRGTSAKLEDLLQGVVDKAAEINPETAQIVGIGSVKYADLKHSPTSDYVFDMKRALSLEGDSGPYLQYTYARCQSVLGKASSSQLSVVGNQGELNTEEMVVLRWLYRFPEVVEEAAREYAPNKVCSYLYELASRYNGFYNKHRVIGSEGSEQFRLALTSAVSQVLKNGLGLLGIEVPTKM